MEDKKSVFISYSSKDVDEVNEVINMLKEADISYWRAPEMIPVGSNYAKEIPRVISQCDIFLLIISKESQNSIWVEKEIDFAINNRKTIVPLNLTNEKLSDMFAFYLNNIQMIYYGDSKAKALSLLKRRLKSLLPIEDLKNDKELKAIEEKTKKIVIEDENYKKEVVDKPRIRKNAFALNPQPEYCKYCNGKLKLIAKGIYKCIKCGAENYDYFQTVRNYLEKAGPCSIILIEKATGVPRASIDYFIRQEMLEIPKTSSARLRCEKCGAPIRTGYICEQCRTKIRR